jgi:hypothetical protein
MKSSIKLSAVLLAVVIAAVMSIADPGQAVNNGVQIWNRGSHKCVSVQGGSTAPLTPLVQEPCANAFGQHWIFLGDVGGIRQLYSLDTGLCARIQSFTNAGAVVQDSCGTGDAGLFWAITDLSVPFPQRRVIFKSSTTNFCLDLENGELWDGLPMQVWQCNSNTNNQKWDVAVPSTKVYPVSGRVTGLAGKCMDVAHGDSTSGTTVQLYHCNGDAAQWWTFPGDGTIRAYGKCLDVAGAGTANGTRVQIWDCNGGVAQQWLATPAFELVNPNSNRCLDVTGANSADWTPLQIYGCHTGDNQRWVTP